MSDAQMITLSSNRATFLYLPPTLVIDKDEENNDRPEMGKPFRLNGTSKVNPAGETTIPRDVWEKSKKHRAVKQWINLGWVKEQSALPAPKTDDSLPDDLMHLNVGSAILMSEGEKVPDETLRAWLAADNRQPVKEAIGKRLGVLRAPAKK